MLKFLIFVFFVVQAYGKSFNLFGGRIVNGTDAEEGEFPFVANLRMDLGYNISGHQCGASILNKDFILTAAHCVYCSQDGTTTADPANFNVQYGLVNITTDDTNSVDILKIHCNNYTEIIDGDFYESFYDTAILQLATSLPDDGSWAPVTLARTFDATVKQRGVVIGWGYIDMDLTPTDVLQKLDLDVYDDTVCGAATRSDWDSHVCVGLDGYGGPCWGDSGTAALIDGIQVGITSYTTTVPPACGHGNAEYPTVYARVDKYFDWILSITSDVQSN